MNEADQLSYECQGGIEMLALIAVGGALSIGVVFWILMLFWLIFGLWSNYGAGGINYRPFGGHILLWCLLFLLGWQVFGFPIGR